MVDKNIILGHVFAGRERKEGCQIIKYHRIISLNQFLAI
jgi:hypothetical protein